MGLAVVLVAVLSLSGLVTQQAWSESQAQGQVSVARHSLELALGRALELGLYASEVAPFRAQAAKISNEAAPTTSILWRSGATQFYRSQARQYARLGVQLAAAERRITRASRSAAEADLSRLQSSISQASGLGLDATAGNAVWHVQSSALRQAEGSRPTPAAYRSVSAQVQAEVQRLSTQISNRRAYLESILAQANSSTAGVQALGERDAASASNDLDLLSLLTSRAAAYRAKLAQLTATLQHDTAPMRAAVDYSAVHDEVSAIHADFLKTVPVKLIVVSTETQYLHAYDHGRIVLTTPVTTGGPELPTDHGVFHIYLKLSPFEFHSPWPPSSPFYYPPTPITYWMPFDGGEGLHDASWRSNFGPGSNLEPTNLGTGRSILGTHGCVNLPFSAATFIWNWAPVGTTVVVG
jgi:lipoprotein-anchoring transpeptidase ErfK/SrfK